MNYREIDESTLLSLVEEPQMCLFENEFKIISENELSIAEFNHRGYTVNDKTELISNSKIQTISFFSGGGGLYIGCQLAGAKVISSLDFDKDSVAIMESNKYFYFAHTKHFKIAS